MNINPSALLIISLIFTLSLHAQPKTNVDVIHELVDKSISDITSGMPVEDMVYYFEYTSLPEYNILNPRAEASFSQNLPVTDNKDKSTMSVKYNLEKTGVNYNKTFKDGFLGTYKVERVFILEGSYIVAYKDEVTKSEDFNFAVSDTVDYDELKSLESISLPFARAEMPPEPLLPSLLEPAIAIAAIAVTVILFFTVRSN